jgi:hypothetical protein
VPQLADLLGLHLDEAAIVISVNGPVGVMNLRAGEALAGDAAWEHLLLRARRLGVHLIVLAGVGHFWLGLATIHGAKNRFNFLAPMCYQRMMRSSLKTIV